jgi:DNA polymerase III subunit delta
MPVITREELRGQLKRLELSPLYLLYGQEAYLRDLAARTIADRSFTANDLRDFNESTFRLQSEDDLQRALDTARQLPMMAHRRVVRVEDVRISATGYRDTVTDKSTDALTGYLTDPAPDTVLIFVADELNGNRRVAKLLKEYCVAVEFTRMDERELAAWARRQFKDAGAEIDEYTLRYLLSRVEPDLRRISNEISKLIAAALPQSVVTADLIDGLVPHTRELSNFELTDHLMAGRSREAMQTLAKVLDEGTEPLALLGLISYNYRRLLMVKDMMARGVDRNQVVKILNMRYRDQEPFLAAARRIDRKTLTNAIDRLSQVDLAIKTSAGGGGPSAARMQLEVLVAELAAR